MSNLAAGGQFDLHIPTNFTKDCRRPRLHTAGRGNVVAGQAGFAYLKHWKPANEAGPPEKKGVLRVKLCEGGWLLEPESAEKTRATYSIYTDTGGSLPAFIANAAGGIGIRKIFAAVRHQAKDPKYRADKDVVEAAR